MQIEVIEIRKGVIDVDFSSYEDGISTEEILGPSEELWSCYQAIARKLLDTAH